MRETRLEIKVGALVLLSVAAAVLLLVLMGELTLGREEQLVVELRHSGNIVKGAPVKLGGVEVGRVRKLELRPSVGTPGGQDLPVELHLKVIEKAYTALRADAKVRIATQGPLGDPYVELEPGTEGAGPYPKGQPLRAVESMGLGEVSEKLAALADTFSGVLTENRDSIKQTLSELSQAANELNATLRVVREDFEPGGSAHGFLKDAAATAKRLRLLTSHLDSEDGKRLKAAVGNLSSVSDRIDAIAERVEAGEGTAGKLLTDKALYEDVRGLIQDIRRHPWKLVWKTKEPEEPAAQRPGSK